MLESFKVFIVDVECNLVKSIVTIGATEILKS